MPQQNYLDELTPAFTPLLAIKEASRCLLCHDAPCSQACPAQTDPGKFIRSIYFRNFKGAAETIRENNALGAVCARVCPTEKLCQSGCTRAGVDAPIDIGRLQRFVTDFEQQTGMEIYQPGTKTLGKVAIIGAGPAGLQASVTLTNQGYDVTIYEKDIGGGDVAMDVASTLKVLGCQAVTCVAREELDEFPASEKEFTSARELGVSIIDGFTPVAVEGNKVTFKHVRLPGELTIAADKIILAVGQHAELAAFSALEPQRNTIETQHYQTRDPQVFAAGDIVEGDKTVVYAVKTGKEAAGAIHHYLEGACSC
ncbi:TPA: FAD-dependent oxidoreductase [Escherichia coli]|nr:FAD-dependent oxidoreductase [Escherichia coli]